MCCRILFTALIITLDIFVSYKLWDEPPLIEYYFGRVISTVGLQFLSFTLLMIIWVIEGKYCGKVGTSCMESETGMCIALLIGGKSGNEKDHRMELKYHPRPEILESEAPESDFGDVEIPETQSLGSKIYPKISTERINEKKQKSKKVRGFFFGKPKFFKKRFGLF